MPFKSLLTAPNVDIGICNTQKKFTNQIKPDVSLIQSEVEIGQLFVILSYIKNVIEQLGTSARSFSEGVPSGTGTGTCSCTCSADASTAATTLDTYITRFNKRKTDTYLYLVTTTPEFGCTLSTIFTLDLSPWFL